MVVKAVEAGMDIALHKPCHTCELGLNLLESRVTAPFRAESM